MVHKLIVILLLGLSVTLVCSEQFDEEEEDEYDSYNDEFYEEEDEEEIEPDDFEEEQSKKNGFELDEDEFIGISDSSTEQQEEDVAPKVIDLGNVLPQPWWQKWFMEILCITFLVVYGINFYVGSQTNLQIATAWGKTYNDLFVEHFAKVGVDAMLSKQTQNVFSMRATGRINCIGLQAVLKLKRRQDLLSRIWDIFSKSDDSLVIDIAMVQEMEPMVFAIVPSKIEKSYRKSNKDVESFATPRSVQKIGNFPSDYFSVIGDNDEIVESILIPKVVNVIATHRNYIQRIHITDQFNHPKYHKVLRFVFKIPTTSKIDELMVLTKMALFFIDHIATLTLSTATKKKSVALRNQAQIVAQKEKAEERQELKQKRQDEKRKLEQQKYDQLTPEQRAKEDQRRAKRDAKKQSSKFKVVYA